MMRMGQRTPLDGFLAKDYFAPVVNHSAVANQL